MCKILLYITHRIDGIKEYNFYKKKKINCSKERLYLLKSLTHKHIAYHQKHIASPKDNFRRIESKSKSTFVGRLYISSWGNQSPRK